MGVLNRIDDVRHVLQPDWRAVAVSNHDLRVFLAGPELVIVIDRPGLRGAGKSALRGVEVCRSERTAQRCHAEPMRRQLRRIRLYAHRRPLAAADTDETHALELRDALLNARFRQLLQLWQRDVSRRYRQSQNRRIRRIRFGVNRWIWQIARQERARAVDRRLHLLFRLIDIEIERELQRHKRAAERADGRHLRKAGHLPELLFERRGHGRRHYLRTRARVESLNLNGRVVDLRQRRNRQLRERNHTGQNDPGHHQRCGHGPFNKDAGRAHCPPPAPRRPLPLPCRAPPRRPPPRSPGQPMSSVETSRGGGASGSSTAFEIGPPFAPRAVRPFAPRPPPRPPLAPRPAPTPARPPAFAGAAFIAAGTVGPPPAPRRPLPPRAPRPLPPRPPRPPRPPVPLISASVRGRTVAPSTRRSVPSTTTASPASSPLEIALSVSFASCTVTGRM